MKDRNEIGEKLLLDCHGDWVRARRQVLQAAAWLHTHWEGDRPPVDTVNRYGKALELLAVARADATKRWAAAAAFQHEIQAHQHQCAHLSEQLALLIAENARLAGIPWHIRTWRRWTGKPILALGGPHGA